MLGREVAIKTLPAEFEKDDERLSRLRREAKLLASLNHPNIATIHSLEEEAGIRFLVLELIEGATLDERIQRGPIPVAEASKIALQIADALGAAHERGIIHRDLKPANIKIAKNGHVKVLDFGIAKPLYTAERPRPDAETLTRVTEQGRLLGTPGYMSPEQIRGEDVDARTDIWAFGVILAEMLTGKLPYGAAAPRSTDPRRANYRSAAHYNPMVPLWLDGALQKGVAVSPADRYAVVSEFVYDLTHPNPRFMYREHRPLLERTPVVFWQTTAAVLAAVCVVLFFLLMT